MSSCSVCGVSKQDSLQGQTSEGHGIQLLHIKKPTYPPQTCPGS